jgi:hypothetical protein
MIFYVEEDWWDDDDIIRYAMKHKHKLVIKSHKELYNMDSEELLKNVYFCNTEIIQHHLAKLNATHLIPDTYEEIYKNLYNREIDRMTFGELMEKYKGKPKFIKPINNDKSFDGRIFTGINDFTDFCQDVPENDTMIYVTEPITILLEARLLVGNNKLYGHCITNNLAKIKSFFPNYLESDLVKKIISMTDNFRCIDIGMNCCNEWFIVEINPPFSLDNHTIDMNQYIEFCIDSCQYIWEKINILPKIL